jgi:hypothetical protein
MSAEGYVEYSSNNSGGSWWVSDRQWFDLESAGWQVAWFAGDTGYPTSAAGYYLGGLASDAKRTGVTLEEAMAEWQWITALDPCAIPCFSSAPPHSFAEYDADGCWVTDGPDRCTATAIAASWS